jgi:hypothetical protein
MSDHVPRTLEGRRLQNKHLRGSNPRPSQRDPRVGWPHNTPWGYEPSRSPENIAQIYTNIYERVHTIMPACIAGLIARYVVGYTRCQSIAPNPPIPSLLCQTIGSTNPIAQIRTDLATWEHDHQDLTPAHIANLAELLDRMGVCRGDDQTAILVYPLIAVISVHRRSILVIDVRRVIVARELRDNRDDATIQLVASNAPRTHLIWTAYGNLSTRIYVQDMTNPIAMCIDHKYLGRVTAICPFGKYYVASLCKGSVAVWCYEDNVIVTDGILYRNWLPNIGSIAVVRGEGGSYCIVTGTPDYVRAWDLDTYVPIQTISYATSERDDYGSVIMVVAMARGFAVSRRNGVVDLFEC